ncbi:MAG: VanZ family protein [Clostridia bacterium]|nr:VanZ family protein [Clostridia bacterium]
MNRALKWILVVLTAALMVFIFVMSASNAARSTDLSRSVGRLIGRLFVSGFDEWDAARQLDFVRGVDHVVRKAAHFLEFTFLGALLYFAASAWGAGVKIAAPIAVIGGVAYALTDEFHQGFVDGRSPEVGDVLLDSAGVVLGCLLAFAIVSLINRRRAARAAK